MLASALALWLSSAAPAEPPPTRFRGALEAVAESFPSGPPGGQQDLFLIATPLLGFDGGDDFGFELGAELRLRLLDGLPSQNDQDFGRVLRREDWDETSDFGQLLRELRIGPEEGAVAVRAGPLSNQSLGHGHLVSRYSNRDNPDYHPCGLTAHLVLGPTRSEFLASDLLAARLFAAETSVDLGRVMSEEPGHFDRYHAAFSMAHDSGAAAGTAITLMHLDFDVALHRSAQARVFAYAGIGSRIFIPAADLGALLGLSVDANPGGVGLGGRLELRKQQGALRQGMFGPGYELARFSAVGFSGPPLAQDALPDGFSGYGELSVASGPVQGTDARIAFSAAAEYYSSGRLDTDAWLALRLLGGRLIATGRLVATGVARVPRYLTTGEVRFRFAPALYTLASAGTVFFPQPDSTLVRGFYGGVGIGVDFER